MYTSKVCFCENIRLACLLSFASLSLKVWSLSSRSALSPLAFPPASGSCFFYDEVTISSWVLVWALEPQHGRPAVKGAPTFQIVTNLVFQVNGALSRLVWWLPQRFPSKKKTRKSTTRTQEISNPNPKTPFFVLVKVKIANHEFRPQFLLSRHS